MNGELPTFDEWFKAKYGETFDERYCFPWACIETAQRAHMHHCAEYLTEMVKRLESR